jgi:hypothetical protein
VNWTHTSAGLTVAGFLWLFAVLFVLLTATSMRVLVSSLVLAAAVMIVARLRQHRRTFQIPSKRWNPAARGNS